MSHTCFAGRLLIWGPETTGTYRIRGIARKTGQPGPYRVLLFLRASGKLFRETWADANGVYIFNNVPYLERGYFVTAHDIAPFKYLDGRDYVTPEPMP